MPDMNKQLSMEDIKKTLSSSLKRALGGGISGASAMIIQVSSLMWLRTTMNYQYRYGATMTQAIKALYKDGGIRRFYRGYLPGLAQGPLARFGDTAANTFAIVMLNSLDYTKGLPIGIKTIGASVSAGLFRIFLMPVDTCKTILQVEGKNGLKILGQKIQKSGIFVIYYGSIASAAATMVGHYPWFATYNILDEKLGYSKTYPILNLCRSALIGFSASLVSDTSSNSIRVLKTYRQTAATKVPYIVALRDVVSKDGLSGLFFRGLKTRLFTNGLQSMMFTILWKYFQNVINKRNAPPRASSTTTSAGSSSSSSTAAKK